jgi:hypothetical protein
MADNVIIFPKEKFNDPSNIQSQEDLLKQITDYKTSFANDISEMLSTYIFGELARSGVNFESRIDELFPAMMLVTESIQSLHLQASGLEHPLQEFAQDLFNENSEEAYKKVDIVDELYYNTLIDENDEDF